MENFLANYVYHRLQPLYIHPCFSCSPFYLILSKPCLPSTCQYSHILPIDLLPRLITLHAPLLSSFALNFSLPHPHSPQSPNFPTFCFLLVSFIPSNPQSTPQVYLSSCLVQNLWGKRIPVVEGGEGRNESGPRGGENMLSFLVPCNSACPDEAARKRKKREGVYNES